MTATALTDSAAATAMGSTARTRTWDELRRRPQPAPRHELDRRVAAVRPRRRGLRRRAAGTAGCGRTWFRGGRCRGWRAARGSGRRRGRCRAPRTATTATLEVPATGGICHALVINHADSAASASALPSVATPAATARNDPSRLAGPAAPRHHPTSALTPSIPRRHGGRGHLGSRCPTTTTVARGVRGPATATQHALLESASRCEVGSSSTSTGAGGRGPGSGRPLPLTERQSRSVASDPGVQPSGSSASTSSNPVAVQARSRSDDGPGQAGGSRSACRARGPDAASATPPAPHHAGRSSSATSTRLRVPAPRRRPSSSPRIDVHRRRLARPVGSGQHGHRAGCQPHRQPVGCRSVAACDADVPRHESARVRSGCPPVSPSVCRADGMPCRRLSFRPARRGTPSRPGAAARTPREPTAARSVRLPASSRRTPAADRRRLRQARHQGWPATPAPGPTERRCATSPSPNADVPHPVRRFALPIRRSGPTPAAWGSRRPDRADATAGWSSRPARRPTVRRSPIRSAP